MDKIKWCWDVVLHYWHKIFPLKGLVASVDKKQIWIKCSCCDNEMEFEVFTVFFNGSRIGVPFVTSVDEKCPVIRVINPEPFMCGGVTVQTGTFTVGKVDKIGE